MITTNLRPRRRSLNVNITPLIDVVFLLLIFFMVSTTFERQSEIQIELPRADTEQEPEKELDYIDITIDRQGVFYVDQREVVNTSVDTLRRALRKALGEREPLPVLISADAQTPHQAVITAMDASGRAGLNRITFATARTEKSGP